MKSGHRLARLTAVASLLVLASGLVLRGATQPEPIRIGAVFPISGNAASLAGPELTGVRIAADQANADGGIDGRPIELEVRDIRSRDDADRVLTDLRDRGIRVVIGAYSSDLSIAASEAAARARPRLLGGGRGCRPADRPGPAAGLPGRDERQQPRRELGGVRGDGAGGRARPSASEPARRDRRGRR